MNNQKNGYNWVNCLAESSTQRPIPLDLDEKTGAAKVYKFPVKVGADMKYATLSEDSNIKAFNGREVKLQDYITPYQIYYTQSYGLARSSENLDGAGSIEGSEAYFNASKQGFNEEAWNDIGIKAKVDEDGKSYLYFTLNEPCTPFYAMYYLSSGMFAPVPAEFISLLGGGDFAKGVATWGKFSSDAKLSPVDTFLSTGPYVVERWDKDSMIVLKKNELFNSGSRFLIPGIHIKIMPLAKNDAEYPFKKFLNGELDYAIIPPSKVKDYYQDNRITVTSNSSTYKLNMNTCSNEQWEKQFGINGAIYQTPKERYWNIKPAMSNNNFLTGLSYALDRKSLAKNLGKTPTGNYIGDTWMFDPKNGVSYNSTPEHTAAVASLRNGTDAYGYSYEKAKEFFIEASNELIAQGAYQIGDTIKIEIAWQTTDQIKNIFNLIKKDFEKAFNVPENPLNLECESWVGDVWSDVYYKKLMVGQFDLGFGSISGGTYHALGFFDYLISDNRSGFTLNWGPDTNAVDGTIAYDHKIWSYDALLSAVENVTYVSHGQYSEMFDVYKCEAIVQSDGSLLVYVYAKEISIDDENFSKIASICLFATSDGERYSDYEEYYVYPYLADQSSNPNFVFNEEEGRYEIIISSDVIAKWLKRHPSINIYMQGIDIYFDVSLLGEKNTYCVGSAWQGYLDTFRP